MQALWNEIMILVQNRYLDWEGVLVQDLLGKPANSQINRLVRETKC